MPRRTRSATVPETFSIWTSFTDLMSNAFMVLTLLLLLVLGQASKNRAGLPSANDQPIIIDLPATKYNFAPSLAILPNNLKEDISGKDGIILKDIENKIKQIEKTNKKVEVIEVIGHTDGQPLGRLNCNNKNGSNLDKKLEEVATAPDNRNVNILCPGSNADLGLMRALAVIKELQTVQQGKKDGRFKTLSFRAYSAAQLLLPENKGFARPEQRNEDEKRRRIEIRFTQLGQYTTPEKNSK